MQDNKQNLKMVKTNKLMMKKTFLLLIGFIFLLNFVNAAPPFSTTTLNILNEGIDITFPELFTYPQGENITSLIWASNSSNGETINNETGYCIFSITNNIGELIYRNPNMSYDGEDFEVGDIPCVYCFHDKILSGNFSELGYYTARYNCRSYDNSSAGVVAKQFEITKTGLDTDVAKAIIQLGFMFLLFCISICFMVLAFKTEQPGLKIFFLLLGFIFIMSCLIFSSIASNEMNLYENFNDGITNMIYIFGIILIVLFAYIMIEQIKSAITSMQENKGYETDF